MDDKKEVIELINRIQSYQRATGCKVDIQLPQIVVVGAQSSGKSSVLDGLIGASILPRGSGTVTKCPIIVQLITTPNPDEEGVEFEDGALHSSTPFLKFSRKNRKSRRACEDEQEQTPETMPNRIKDYDLVRDKINERMNANDGAISDEPIIIRVYSPNVVTLTVVDLPGVKRLTSTGEPSDLEQLIFNLSRKYINEKNAIILAVSPSNYDICNSDGLLLAREADPEGVRTIGVLTKLDLMDKGTDARELLTGTSKDVQVKLGMIGLVNRSQEDINNNLTVENQLEKEKRFFADNYSDLAEVNGVPFLRKRLQELLVKQIIACLPQLLKEMEEKLHDCKKRLEDIPDVLSARNRRMLANEIINRFEQSVKQEIEGSVQNPELKYLYGGIKIKDAFEEHFPKEMNCARRMSTSFITDEMITNAFRNSGSYNSFFDHPEAVFRMLATKQVACIEEPALKCAMRVYNEIMAVSARHSKGEGILIHFHELRSILKSVVTNMIESNLEYVELQIKDYIRLQSKNLFSLDVKFLEKLNDLRRKLEKILHGDADSEDANSKCHVMPFLVPKNSGERILLKLENPSIIQLIKDMANLYYDHINGHCLDFIPKLIADKLITQFSTDGKLGNELRFAILEKVDLLMKLPPNVQKQREQDEKMKTLLEKVSFEVKETLSHAMYDEEILQGKWNW